MPKQSLKLNMRTSCQVLSLTQLISKGPKSSVRAVRFKGSGWRRVDPAGTVADMEIGEKRARGRKMWMSGENREGEMEMEEGDIVTWSCSVAFWSSRVPQAFYKRDGYDVMTVFD